MLALIFLLILFCCIISQIPLQVYNCIKKDHFFSPLAQVAQSQAKTHQLILGLLHTRYLKETLLDIKHRSTRQNSHLTLLSFQIVVSFFSYHKKTDFAIPCVFYTYIYLWVVCVDI